MKARTITNLTDIFDTILKSEVCYVGMVDDSGMPYVLPMNFGLKDGFIYLHSARSGKKISILEKNPKVCVCFSNEHFLRWQNESVACSYSMKYKSVLAHGEVEFIEESEEKVRALNIIMHHYTGKEFKYSAPSIREILIWRVRVDKWEGRYYRY
ncbi:MAG TPA: pyridoxamine 5'-phosphate oxidase family protein [Bacteroidales bacterium]|nr:pyridoxamine 5'-phosphate oxidase family protein [Bacteroidales bacterium]HQH15228.1 pyridoxamine 5'-phosphate oxidase family protein [Bacteroidales bacterium]HQO08412.1 pyridoxamine 5'-phosphate oxidase family protein [Bacteroidales bacterium]HQP53888.1 pyridoxamine 5'-phosphate oxidase family protein [Bacteroidales bacterium]